ncbi:MAG: hypothetical protein HKL83_06600 [Acidimicrobiaceae bacterium]|nr:hypothetical protein [Acidimicrobiaceae bacterium]
MMVGEKKKGTASRPKAASKGGGFQRINVVGLSAVSVFKVFLIFYSLMAAVLVIAGIVLWNLAAAAGLTHKLNHLIESLTGSTNYAIHGIQVLVIGVGFLVVLVAVSSVVTAIAARIFNFVAELVGGIGLNIRSGASKATSSG